MNRNRYGRSIFRMSLLLLFLGSMLCPGFTVAPAEGIAAIIDENWTWEIGGTASFSGTFAYKGEDLSDAVLTLTLETGASGDQGTVVFTEINGKKVKIRNRSDTLTAEIQGNGAENTFQGEWYLPEDEAIPPWAVLRFQAADGMGKTLASAELRMGESGEAATEARPIPADRMDQLEILLIGLAVILWAAAILRSVILRKKAQRT